MPPQQGFGGGFDPGGVRSTPVTPPRQQGFGSSLGSFLGGQGFNMPQQMRNPMRPMVGQMAPEQNQPSATPAPSTDMNTVMDPFRQQVNQMMQQRGMGGGPQPVLGTPGGNLVGGMDPRMLRPNVNRSLSQPQMPPNPYAQQVRQEDPRMQAMRMMQRMRFGGGGGGGYNF
jgi:hypothetical protein